MKQLLRSLVRSRRKNSETDRSQESLRKRALHAEAQKNYAAAAGCWQELDQNVPNTKFRENRDKAIEAYTKDLLKKSANGEPDLALSMGKTFLREFGEHPRVLEFLAAIEQGRERFVSASRWWLTWAELRTAATEKRYIEAYQAFVNAGFAANAERMLQEAERLNGKRPKVLYRRAALLESQHRWNEAEQVWSELQRVAGHSQATEARRLMCVTEIDPVRAEAELLANSPTENGYWPLFRIRVRLAQKRLDWNAAFLLLHEAASLFPDEDNAWTSLAHAHISRLEFSEAGSICRSRLAKTGKPVYLFLLVEVLLQARQINEAEDELRSIQVSEKDALKFAELQSKALRARGRDIEAARLLEASLEQRRGNIKLLIELAMLYIRAGQTDDAYRIADWISTEYDERTDVAELRAWQAALRGNITAARARWSSSVRRSVPSLRPLDTPLQPLKPVPPPASLQLFAFFRNERARLEYFLDYYRDLGVERFYLVDNGSTDGSGEFLKPLDDVFVFRTEESYREAVSGMRWINDLVKRFGGTGWAIHVDLDEFLVLPGVEGKKLPSYTAYLERYDYEVVRGFMLDMFPDGDGNSSAYKAGDNPAIYCPYFDNSYRFYGAMRAPYWWVEGGMRERVFQQYDLYLCKTPLIRAGRDISFLASSHFVSPGAVADITSVLLHFKFLGSFKSRIEEEAKRLEYSNSAKNVKHLHARLSQIGSASSWLGPDTERYRGSEQLLELGLLRSGCFGNGGTVK